MRRRKSVRLKHFLRIFFLLAVIQFIIVVGDMLLQRGNISLSSVTSVIIDVLSLPISLIHPSLPFYAGEGLVASIAFWVLNLTIQTMIIYGAIVIVEKLKENF